MTQKLAFATATLLLALFGVAGQANGQAAAPITGNTLWHFMGIPQGFNKVYDNGVNRNGNRPGLERQPPLKSIADPSNLDPSTPAGQNPAIKTAAQIKQQEDLKKQKIKAIKYLATVGCCCYKGVDQALMDALDDCTEEVRYEAAKAIGDAAKNNKCGCSNGGCNKNCCCSEEMSKKLAEIAYEKDDKCCWLESSERVRQAAKEDLSLCCPGTGPGPSPGETPPDQKTKGPEVVPTPGGPEVTPPTRPETTPGLPTPPPALPTPPGTSVKNPQMTRMPVASPRLNNDVSNYQWTPSTARSEKSPALDANSPPTNRKMQVFVKNANGQWSSAVNPEPDVLQLAPRNSDSESDATNVRNRPTVVVALRRESPSEFPGSPSASPIVDDLSTTSSATPRKRSIVIQTSSQVEGASQLATRQPPVAAETPPQLKAGQLVQGKIAELDLKNRAVRMVFPHGGEPEVGVTVKVNHAFLLGPAEVGELEIVRSKDGVVIGQPVGNLSFGKMSRDDSVTYRKVDGRDSHSAPTLADAAR